MVHFRVDENQLYIYLSTIHVMAIGRGGGGPTESPFLVHARIHSRTAGTRLCLKIYMSRSTRKTNIVDSEYGPGSG